MSSALESLPATRTRLAIAFGITLYASVNLTRHSRKLPM